MTDLELCLFFHHLLIVYIYICLHGPFFKDIDLELILKRSLKVSQLFFHITMNMHYLCVIVLRLCLSICHYSRLSSIVWFTRLSALSRDIYNCKMNMLCQSG